MLHGDRRGSVPGGKGAVVTAVPVSGIRRRAYMTEPGEPLEVASSISQSAARYRAFVADAGIAPPWVRRNPMCAVPLPVYPASWPGRGRRWPGVSPLMMWHPLLWLPDRLATRYTLVGEDGERDTEPDDVWALRVCLELQAAGCYDAGTGSWLDVLSLAGLDADDPDTLRRVDNWLQGAADSTLDRLHLTEHVDRPGDLDWALHAAIDVLPALRVISWAATAQDLLDACDSLTGSGGDPDVIRNAALAIALLGRDNLASLPDDTGRAPSATGRSGEGAWWDSMAVRIRESTGDTGPLIETVVPDMADRLAVIADIYAPQAAELAGQDPQP